MTRGDPFEAARREAELQQEQRQARCPRCAHTQLEDARGAWFWSEAFCKVCSFRGNLRDFDPDKMKFLFKPLFQLYGVSSKWPVRPEHYGMNGEGAQDKLRFYNLGEVFGLAPGHGIDWRNDRFGAVRKEPVHLRHGARYVVAAMLMARVTKDCTFSEVGVWSRDTFAVSEERPDSDRTPLKWAPHPLSEQEYEPFRKKTIQPQIAWVWYEVTRWM